MTENTLAGRGSPSSMGVEGRCGCGGGDSCLGKETSKLAVFGSRGPGGRWSVGLGDLPFSSLP